MGILKIIFCPDVSIYMLVIGIIQFQQLKEFDWQVGLWCKDSPDSISHF